MKSLLLLLLASSANALTVRPSGNFPVITASTITLSGQLLITGPSGNGVKVSSKTVIVDGTGGKLIVETSIAAATFIEGNSGSNGIFRFKRSSNSGLQVEADNGPVYFVPNVGIGTLPGTKLHMSSGTLTVDGTSPAINIGGAGVVGTIRANTVDGTDNSGLGLHATGGQGPTRGASIQLFGNENGDAGDIYYDSGNVAGGSHIFRAGAGSTVMTMNDSLNVLIGTMTIKSAAGLPQGVALCITSTQTLGYCTTAALPGCTCVAP